MKKITLFALMSLFALAIISCGDGGSKSADKKADDETEKKEEASDREGDGPVRNTTIVFPSAPEIMTVFKSAGLKYKPEIANPVSNKKNYDTRFQKAIAIGVFTADLAYSVTHSQNSSAMEYMKVVVELSEELGISGVSADDSLLNEFEAALGNEEKTLDIIGQIQKETDEHIEGNDMQDWATLIFSGAWLEGMYIGVAANDNFSKSELSLRIAEQMSIMENMLRALRSTELSGAEFDDYMVALKRINEMYLEYPEVKNADRVPELTLGQLREVADEVKKLRNKLI